MLQELIELGFHDAEIESINFNFRKNELSLILHVANDEIVEDNGRSSYLYRKGILSFESVKSCNIDEQYDFKNKNLMLSGELNNTGCNIFLTSNQRLTVECENVVFKWAN